MAFTAKLVAVTVFDASVGIDVEFTNGIDRTYTRPYRLDPAMTLAAIRADVKTKAQAELARLAQSETRAAQIIPFIGSDIAAL